MPRPRIGSMSQTPPRVNCSRPGAHNLPAGQRPPQHLDYFHGALAVSPSGAWIADDGWVWHPYGIVRTWSAEAWLEGNAWESEDGSSVRLLCQRAYYWDKPVCWVGDTALAVTGIGSDDDHIISGVASSTSSPGWSSLHSQAPREICSTTNTSSPRTPEGLEASNPWTGERLARLEGFRPSRHYRSARSSSSRSLLALRLCPRPCGQGRVRRPPTRRPVPFPLQLRANPWVGYLTMCTIHLVGAANAKLCSG